MFLVKNPGIYSIFYAKHKIQTPEKKHFKQFPLMLDLDILFMAQERKLP